MFSTITITFMVYASAYLSVMTKASEDHATLKTENFTLTDARVLSQWDVPGEGFGFGAKIVQNSADMEIGESNPKSVSILEGPTRPTIVIENQYSSDLKRGPALTFLDEGPKIISVQQNHAWQTQFHQSANHSTDDRALLTTTNNQQYGNQHPQVHSTVAPDPAFANQIQDFTAITFQDFPGGVHNLQNYAPRAVLFGSARTQDQQDISADYSSDDPSDEVSQGDLEMDYYEERKEYMEYNDYEDPGDNQEPNHEQKPYVDGNGMYDPVLLTQDNFGFEEKMDVDYSAQNPSSNTKASKIGLQVADRRRSSGGNFGQLLTNLEEANGKSDVIAEDKIGYSLPTYHGLASELRASSSGGHKGGALAKTRPPGPYGYPSPNFKCEYAKETLYVTKTDWTFDKKCFTVYRTKCRHEYDEGKGIGFKKECSEFTVTRCRTEYDTDSETKCWTVFRKECFQVYVTKVDWEYEEKCETKYEEVCEGYGYDKHCHSVPKEHCHQVRSIYPIHG